MFRFESPSWSPIFLIESTLNSRLANRRIRALSRNAKSNSYYKMRTESLEKTREVSHDFTKSAIFIKKKKKTLKTNKKLPVK